MDDKKGPRGRAGRTVTRKSEETPTGMVHHASGEQEDRKGKWVSRRTVVWKLSRRELLLRGALAAAVIASVCVAGMFIMRMVPSKREIFGVGQRYVPALLPVSLEKGWVSSEFGMRTDPITGKMRMHEGIDLAVDEGVPVKAAADGRVIFAGDGGGYGNIVKIEHGTGIETRYAHNSVLRVEKGGFVRRGQVIALAGHTGRVKGNPGDHLHYEVRVNGKPVDPRKYLPPFVEGGRKGQQPAS